MQRAEPSFAERRSRGVGAAVGGDEWGGRLLHNNESAHSWIHQFGQRKSSIVQSGYAQRSKLIKEYANGLLCKVGCLMAFPIW